MAARAGSARGARRAATPPRLTGGALPPPQGKAEERGGCGGGRLLPVCWGEGRLGRWGPPGGARPAGAQAASLPLRCKAVAMLGGDEFISSPPRKTVRFGGTLTDILLKYEKVTAAPPRRPSRLPAGGCSPSRLRDCPAR